ncbi:hypothetical protein ElyMa_005637600 [Elysia marginata]|uniref:CYRIA/CYRIB Rac1 binding domain-containing protein n=1 Tax=Elysia marginata TaxID=1093978 RepID=A0AAV4F8I2_9GAST|nr:hypothetical protein ElyMa_005637600 [Elysia marginata]
MYADEVSLKQVRFGGSLGGRITGKPRLAPIKRTPRDERSSSSNNFKPMVTPTPTSSPRSRTSVATEEQGSDDEGYRTARSGGDDLLLDDLKEKLRPVIDHRMPTLVTKRGMFATDPASATVQIQNITRRRNDVLTKGSEAPSFLTSPPRNMHYLREAIFKEIKVISKALNALEREYYGDRANINGEVERYAYSVRMLMKALMIFDLNNAPAIDDLIRIATNTNRYKGEPKYIADIKEVHAKVQTFMPDKVMSIVAKCQTLLDAVIKYCVSFYVPGTDHYLETADHYWY